MKLHRYGKNTNHWSRLSLSTKCLKNTPSRCLLFFNGIAVKFVNFSSIYLLFSERSPSLLFLFLSDSLGFRNQVSPLQSTASTPTLKMQNKSSLTKRPFRKERFFYVPIESINVRKQR